jgi:ankyrin repeat protein
MRYSKFRFWTVFFGIGVIFFAVGGGAVAAGGNKDVLDFLDRGETDKAREFFQGKVDVNIRDSHGRTPLHKAAKLGDRDLADFFISRGAKVDAVDDDGRTPLHIAAEEGNSALAALLISRGAKVDAVDDDGWTPLGIAAGKLDSQAAAVLVQGGGNIHAKLPLGLTVAGYALKDKGAFLDAILTPESVKSTGDRKRTILHLAADAGESESIRMILAKNAPLNEKDNSGRTALDLALSHTDESKYAEAAELIILAGGTSTDPVYAYFEPAVRSINYDFRFTDGLAPLHYAARDGNIALVTYLLGKNADPDVKTASGATPLHEAAREGRLKVMKELIARGADINIQDAKGNSVLHTAIPEKEAVVLLLDAGAAPNLRDEHGDSPLHIAITLNRRDIVETLLERGADVSIHNMAGKTPLYIAVEKNQSAYTIPLLIKYKSDIFAADNNGVTPFEKALKEESPVLEAMITEESVLQSDSGGNTALHIAIKNGAEEKIIRLILNAGALVNARNKEGDTSLHLAVRLNLKEIGELLLSQGADIFAPNSRSESPIYLTFYSPGGGVREWVLNDKTLSARDGLGNSVLHYVAQWRLDLYVPDLVNNRRVDPDAVNATGETPLFVAVKINSPSTVRALISANAAINHRDSLGNNALHVAVRWNAAQSAKILCDNEIDINAHALTGKTPLHDAVRLGILDVETILIKAGADLDARDNEGNTPLMEAILAGPPSAVARLSDFGADTNIRNNQGDTPLHLAVRLERSDLIALLLSRGASIHAKNTRNATPFTLALDISPRMVSTLLIKDWLYASDDDGYSPLHIAIAKGAPVNIVKAILDQGAKLTAADSQGRTPLRMAVDFRNWEAVRLLADSGSNPFSAAADGKTPAGIALASGSEALQALFSGKAIGSQDPAGNTILHYAAQAGSGEQIALLIRLGANMHSKNIRAESPADIARRQNRANNIVAILEN